MTETPELPEPGSMASEPLDVVLKSWHDTSLPTTATKKLNKAYPLQEAANAHVAAVEVVMLASIAAFIDAYRVHPDLSYRDSSLRLQVLLSTLPTPATEAEVAAAMAEGLGI